MTCKHACVRLQVGDGYELDDDPNRIDVEGLVAFLTTEAYWGRWRTRDDIERQLAASWRLVAVYQGDAMVGFARAVSDGVALAYLADVYVDPAHRGRGLGAAVVREIVEGRGASSFRWMLHTKDAHGLYTGLGFTAPGPDMMERHAGRR